MSFVGSVMHHFHMSYQHTLWEISYRSLSLLSLSVPSVDENKAHGKKPSIQEFIQRQKGKIKKKASE